MITYCILGFTVVFSLIGMNNPEFFNKYLFNPYRLNGNRKEWYTVFTHAFLHGSYGHLLWNMLALYSFGLALEQELLPAIFHSSANIIYLVLYFGGMIVSSFPSYEKNKNNPGYSSIGASGAVCAICFSFILINPLASIYMMFIPIGIPAAIFGIAFLIISWILAKRGGSRIGHDAHFWGSIYGFVLTGILHPVLFKGFYYQLISLFQ